MRKAIIILVTLTVFTLTACTINNYSASLAGVSDNSIVAVKDFTTLGIITVKSTEIHHASPFGFVKTVEGSKITYADLMQEAARLEADDIINVRIDMNTNYKKTAFDGLTGWTKTYSYTGTALAIKYTEKTDTAKIEPQLSGLPKIPETTKAVKVTRSGRVVLR